MRLSLQELFGLVAFFAVMAWCVAWVGVDNGLFWLAAVLSAVFSVVFVRTARHPEHHAKACCLFVPVLFCCMCTVGSPVLGLNVVLASLAGIFCYQHPFTTRRATKVAMLCASLAFVAAVLMSLKDVRRLEELRRKWPPISLATRLAYEKHKPAKASDRPSSTVLSAAISLRLVDLEDRLERHSFRQRELAQIHDQWSEKFIRAQGFGVGRMVAPRIAVNEIPPLRDIDFDELAVSPRTTRGQRQQESDEDRKVTQAERIHERSFRDFFDTDGFGAKLPGELMVAGFVEHAFRESANPSSELLSLVRLELVSLLRFAEPRVYVLDHLPRMDQLNEADVVTRPLDDFEADALKKLWTDEDIIVSEQTDATRMLGSLRAAKPCLQCHDVDRGALLGAFNYVLRRTE